MSTTFILHGLGADSSGNWFPWLASELQKSDRKVIVPNFPNSMQPSYAEWRDHLDAYAENISEATTFIAHSLGCPFGLQYLAEKNLTIQSFILVAPPFTNLGWPQLEDIMEHFPPENAQSIAKQFHLLASDNDPYIPLDHIAQYEQLLGVKAQVLENREHLWQRELPELTRIL